MSDNKLVEEKIDILYEIRYSSFILNSILWRYDETVCHTLYGSDCANVWRKFDENRNNLATFLSQLSPDQKQKFLKWVSESIDINLIRNTAKGVELMIPPVPKKFFLDPKMARDQKRQMIKMQQKSIEEAEIAQRECTKNITPIHKPLPPPVQISTRPPPIINGHSIKATNGRRIPSEMNDFLKRQIHNTDNPLRQAFINKIERVRKNRENRENRV